MLIHVLGFLLQAQPVDTPRKTILAPVTVKATALKPARYDATMKFDEFYRRRALGLGKFFTREDLERSRATAPADMLVGMTGVKLFRPAAAQKPMIKLNRCPYGAGLSLFLDGTYVPGVGVSTAETLFEMHVNDIEAMEVYTNQTQLPQEAVGYGCAAVFIWTRYTPGSVLNPKAVAKAPERKPTT